MADLDEHKLRDLEAAIATAIHQALVVGVDPKYIGGLLQGTWTASAPRI